MSLREEAEETAREAMKDAGLEVRMPGPPRLSPQQKERFIEDGLFHFARQLSEHFSIITNRGGKSISMRTSFEGGPDIEIDHETRKITLNGIPQKDHKEALYNAVLQVADVIQDQKNKTAAPTAKHRTLGTSVPGER